MRIIVWIALTWMLHTVPLQHISDDFLTLSTAVSIISSDFTPPLSGIAKAMLMSNSLFRLLES